MTYVQISLWALAMAAPLSQGAAELSHALRVEPAAAGTRMPRPAVVFFWASWCVPCRQELKRVPALRAAARPLPLVLLALDPPDTARAALAAVRVTAANSFADARPPSRVLGEWGAARLPLAVAVDARGRVCGRKQGLLGTDEVKAWARRCS